MALQEVKLEALCTSATASPGRSSFGDRRTDCLARKTLCWSSATVGRSFVQSLSVVEPARVVVLAGLVRISVFVDARFSLIVDDETASSKARRRGVQVPGWNVAQPSTISLKRAPARGVSGLVLGFD